MRLIIENSEPLFLDTLNSYVNSTAKAKRCLEIRLTESERNIAVENTSFQYTITDILHDICAQCYVNSDGECYIIPPTNHKPAVVFSRDQVEHLSTKLAQLFGYIDAKAYQAFKKRIIIHDLDISLFSLLVKMEEKVRQIKLECFQQEQEALKQAANAAYSSVMHMKVDNQLVKSLCSKRDNRQEISILVVEDDAFSSNLVKKALSKQHTVYTAHTGKLAIEQYFAIVPDVVFLDIDLPDVTGHDVLAKLLQHDKDAYVVMLSANSQKDNVVAAIEKGAKGFVGKPFSKEKLLENIQRSPKCNPESVYSNG